MQIDYDRNVMTSIWEEYLGCKSSMDYTTLYIHFPYCPKKCSYCMHGSIECSDTSVIDDTISNLEEQFKLSAPVFNGEQIKALYFGGGCQTLLSANQIERLLGLVNKYWNLQISDQNMMAYEIHPAQITDDKIEVLKNSYINRVSMGIQSFDERVIKASNRIFVNKNDILNTYDKLRNGFSRVNIDFMYGLKEQTDNSFFMDIKTMVEADAQRITMYGYNDARKNRPITDIKEYEKKHLDMMMHIDNIFSNHGYELVGSKPGSYHEWNVFFKNDKDYSFEYFYNTTPVDFNNNIAFLMGEGGFAPESWFIPLGLYILENQKHMRIKSVYASGKMRTFNNFSEARKKVFLGNPRNIGKAINW